MLRPAAAPVQDLSGVNAVLQKLDEMQDQMRQNSASVSTLLFSSSCPVCLAVIFDSSLSPLLPGSLSRFLSQIYVRAVTVSSVLCLLSLLFPAAHLLRNRSVSVRQSSSFAHSVSHHALRWQRLTAYLPCLPPIHSSSLFSLRFRFSFFLSLHPCPPPARSMPSHAA